MGMNVFDKPKATDERKGEIQKTSLLTRTIHKITRRESNCPMDNAPPADACPYGEDQ